MVVPLFLTLVYGASAPMASLQGGVLSPFQRDSGSAFQLLYQTKMFFRINTFLKIVLKYAFLSHSVTDIRFLRGVRDKS